jgi:hypothetical protein
VTIDVTTPDSPGFWMQRLSDQLHRTDRQMRLNALENWYRGDPPLPEGASGARSAFVAFQRFARSNFAALIVEALRERMRQRGVRTAADSDDTGDAAAWRLWRSMRGPSVASEVHRMVGKFGEAYALVGEPGPDGVPVLTAEDPRFVIAERDPLRPWSPLAGLKLFRDDIAGRDYAFLFRPGRLDVAFREAKGHRSQPVRFGASWDLDLDKSGPLKSSTGAELAGLMPLVAFDNLDGAGEFEPHLDLLSRINHMILQRMMIATLQAFRQRALKGAPMKDDQGKLINWNDILTADPAALWALPASVELWESGQVDLTPILSAVKADVIHLAAVSRTPMSMLDPGGENQSAEGAALAREGLVFKAEDRIERVSPSWAQVVSAAYTWLDDDRKDLASIDFLWASPLRMSLTERAAASAQARAAGVPWRTIMIDVMGFDPDHVDRMEGERLDDMLLAEQFAQVRGAQLAAPQITNVRLASQEQKAAAKSGDTTAIDAARAQNEASAAAATSGAPAPTGTP